MHAVPTHREFPISEPGMIGRREPNGSGIHEKGLGMGWFLFPDHMQLVVGTSMGLEHQYKFDT